MLLYPKALFGLLLFIFLRVDSLYAQFTFPDNRAQVDETVKLVVCNGLPSGNPATVTIRGKTFSMPAVSNLQYGVKYHVSRNGISYSLYFTELPLLVVGNLDEGQISRDGAEILGDMTMSDTEKGYQHEYKAALRFRGNFSVTFPKKSYRMQIKNASGTSNQNVPLLGMRSDRRWLLLALWNEELKLVNRVSHQLWLDMHKLPHADPDRGDGLPQASIRTRFVDMFINGSYKGVYLFTEDLDQKQLGLSSQGELYKADNESNETNFRGAASPPSQTGNEGDYYSGFEMRYKGGSNWANLHQLIRLVVQGSDSEFSSSIFSRLSKTSAMDYFIFINLLYARDNHEKNYFLANVTAGEPYFFGIWDLDATWGYDPSGLRFYQYNQIVTNGLFDRLLQVNPGNYKQTVAQRWFQLRQGVFSSANLITSFNEEFDYLQKNGVYERDILVAQDRYSQRGRADALNYVQVFIAKRLVNLDAWFGQMLSPANCDFNLQATISEDIVRRGEAIQLTGNCTGADCGSANLYWWNNHGWSENGTNVATTAPGTEGTYSYFLAAEKPGCPTKNLQKGVVVNRDGSRIPRLDFAFYGIGGVGFRDYLAPIVNNGTVNLRLLNGLNPGLFMVVSNAQELSPTSSNYFDHVEMRFYRNSQQIMGWGPESIANSEGPYGLYSRFGTASLTLGNTYRLLARAWRGNQVFLEKEVTFTVVDEVPLPVTLISFEGREAGEGQVDLFWETSLEQNFASFEIEKIAEDGNWKTLGSVPGGGGEGGRAKYNFRDPDFDGSGLRYYRLKQVDLDGTFEYSRIISVMLRGKSAAFVHHDLSQHKVWVRNCPELNNIEIVNGMGLVVRSSDAKGENAISLSGLQPGIYFVKYRTASGSVGKWKVAHIN